MRLGDEHPGSGEPSKVIGAQVGPFTLLRRLGDDGPASVYLAEHAVLATRRTVKLLAPPHGGHPAVLCFVAEARAAARLQHRNLIRIHDVGQLASGAWYMVLDHVDGGTLADWMARNTGPMPLDAIAPLIGEVAAGLTALHGRDIVHRGVTPDHIAIIDGDSAAPREVVLGFGAGKPAYMSPEQLRGAPVTPAADVFALGVVAYQLTTGGWFPHQHGESRTGYGELSAAELYHRQVSGPPIDPRDRVPGLPAAWAEAVVAAIAAEPSRRPVSAVAFARSLAEALARRAPASGLASRYQLGERLGGGGMAEVFAATMLGAEGFARRVAIKRVLPGLSQIPAFAAMFVREARIASRLAHPNIVSVLDFARDADGRLCLVMEYVDGVDLASLLATGPIAPSLASYIALEMLRGLGHAHGIAGGDERVVHRDVSPQNLLLGHDGAVKVSDFGLAKVRAASGEVGSDVVRGKPSYMSPEQISGEPLDGRADLYAAGVMLWEMLAGRTLFAGTAREITAQVMFKDVARPSTVRAGVPADLEAVTMTLLARDRDARFTTADAAIAALLGCADLPRDGRGDLVRLLAERFGGAAGAAPVRGLPAASVGPTTAVAPASAFHRAVTAAIRFAPPRRRVFAATLGMIAIAAIAAGLVLARGEVAQSRTTERSAPPAIAAIAPAPLDAGAGDAGELVITVRPGAQIWLNGVPSGQTPFRAVLPAGRYRVRIANGADHDEVTTVTVEPDRTATVERSW